MYIINPKFQFINDYDPDSYRALNATLDSRQNMFDNHPLIFEIRLTISVTGERVSDANIRIEAELLDETGRSGIGGNSEIGTPLDNNLISTIESPAFLGDISISVSDDGDVFLYNGQITDFVLNIYMSADIDSVAELESKLHIKTSITTRTLDNVWYYYFDTLSDTWIKKWTIDPIDTVFLIECRPRPTHSGIYTIVNPVIQNIEYGWTLGSGNDIGLRIQAGNLHKWAETQGFVLLGIGMEWIHTAESLYIYSETMLSFVEVIQQDTAVVTVLYILL
jgi:hypothetical protein